MGFLVKSLCLDGFGGLDLWARSLRTPVVIARDYSHTGATSKTLTLAPTMGLWKVSPNTWVGLRRMLLLIYPIADNRSYSGTKNREVLDGFFCKMYASLGCGALSAKGTLLAQYPWILFASLGVTLGSAENPFAKTPFSRFLSCTPTSLCKMDLLQSKNRPWKGGYRRKS